MGNLVGKVIGGVVGGALTIGGVTMISQLDTQTDEINKHVDAMNVLAEKVVKEYHCFAVENKCAVVEGTSEEYVALYAQNDKTLEEYNTIVNKYNSECATGREIAKSDEQKCIDLNNDAAKMVDTLTAEFEKLDKFVADI